MIVVQKPHSDRRGKDGYVTLDTSHASHDANDLASRKMAFSCVPHVFRGSNIDAVVKEFNKS
jgi:hypothetical protein